MPNPVSAAIGTQRQFSKQPERPYALQLKNPNFGRGVNIGADQGAALLAQSLGVFGNGILNESIAQDKRKREQFTTEDAMRMIAGSTPEDLAQFDRVNALQHSGKGFDLTDNPYAMANLDRAIGQTASTYARQQWADDAETSKPKTINEAVQSFNNFLQENYNNFKDNIHNQYAFDAGFFEEYQKDVLKVASAVHKRINDEARTRGQNVCNIKMQELMLNSNDMSTQDFTTNMGALARNLQQYCKTSEEAMNIIGANLGYLVQNATDTEKLNAIKDVKFFGDRKLGDELPMFKFYQKIADNKMYLDVDSIYKRAMRPDGTIDWTIANKLVAGLEGIDPIANGIPQVNLPISEGDNPDLNNLSPTMKGILPSVGGLLSLMGYGDIAQITSGYRTAEHNAEVGGVPNSDHTKGEALDIYLGNLSKSEVEDVYKKFKPYFRNILFHNAGSGEHLHLAGYIGGLGNKADNNTRFPFAYNPDMKKKIMSRLEAVDTDAKRAAKQRMDDLYQNTLKGASTAKTEAEALDLIANSGLPITKQQTLSKVVKAQFKAINSGNLTIEQQQMIRYEKSKLWSDLEVMDEYNRRVNSNNEDGSDMITPEFQTKANAACSRIVRYWKSAYGKNYDKGTSNVQSQATTATNGSSGKTKEELIAEFKDAGRQLLNEGKSREFVEDRIISLADQYGLDGVAIINELDSEDNNEY